MLYLIKVLTREVSILQIIIALISVLIDTPKSIDITALICRVVKVLVMVYVLVNVLFDI